jgi:hypothetical protein
MNDYIAFKDVLIYMAFGFGLMQTGVTIAVLAAAARPTPDFDPSTGADRES